MNFVMSAFNNGAEHHLSVLAAGRKSATSTKYPNQRPPTVFAISKKSTSKRSS